MYYSSFDWLSPEQLEQLLPEDGVPEDLNFQDIDEALPTGGLTRVLFVDLTGCRRGATIARWPRRC